MVCYEKKYNTSLLMIKILDIKNEKEYNRLLQNYLLLSSESLKCICNTRSFSKIIKIAKAVS